MTLRRDQLIIDPIRSQLDTAGITHGSLAAKIAGDLAASLYALILTDNAFMAVRRRPSSRRVASNSDEWTLVTTGGAADRRRPPLEAPLLDDSGPLALSGWNGRRDPGSRHPPVQEANTGGAG